MKRQPSQRHRLLKQALSFTITPETTSEAPYQLQPGKSVVFKIQVTNQSDSADLIFLKCSELPTNWFTIEYLNQASEDTPGIIQLTEKLALNPQASGEIRLTLHPPIDAAIGNYFPTLQLISMSAPDLVTLDVIYIQLLPDTHLDIRLTPESRTIPKQSAAFNFMVRNRGNVTRTLRLEVNDSRNLFRFETDLVDNVLKLAPGQERTIAFKAFPHRAWQRPLRGNPVRSHVGVTLIPVDGLADAGSRYLTQAKLFWLPQPKWVLALLTLMGAGTALFALGVLYRFNRPAIAAPEIASFNATGQSDTVRLNWKLNNPETLGRVVISQLNEGAEVQTVRYDFSTSIPQELKAKAASNQGCRTAAAKDNSSALWQLPLPNLPWFASLQQVPTPTTITCQNIPFVSNQAGTLRYKLKLFSKSTDAQVPIAEYTTNAIAIKPGSNEPQFEPNSPSAQPAQISLALSINGMPATSQPTHNFSVREGEAAQIVVSWSVQGSTDVQLLPGSGNVEPNGSATYTLQAGESQTVTLTAQNAAGERVTQSAVINAIGVGSSDRSPFRPGSPFQPQRVPKAIPKSGDPTPPESANTQSSPDPNNPVPDQSSPAPSTSEAPTPSASPTASP
jgi:hypothetical protein